MVDYVTNSIEGFMYIMKNSSEKTSVNTLGDLLELIDLQETLGTSGNALTTLQDEGSNYSSAYQSLSNALSGLTGSELTAVQNVLNNTDFHNAYIHYGQSNWTSLKTDITNLRTSTSTTFENLVETAFDTLTDDASVIKHPSIQDILVFSYGIAGSSIFTRQVNELTQDLENSHLALDALNDLYSVAALQPSESDINMDITLNGMLSDFYGMQSQFADSYDTLKKMLANGQILESYQTDVETVLTQASNLVKEIKQTNNSKSTSLQSFFKSYWNDMNTVDQINSVVYDMTFINTKTQQQIQESIMIYEQFTSSTTKLLSRVHSLLRTMSQLIDG